MRKTSKIIKLSQFKWFVLSIFTFFIFSSSKKASGLPYPVSTKGKVWKQKSETSILRKIDKSRWLASKRTLPKPKKRVSVAISPKVKAVKKPVGRLKPSVKKAKIAKSYKISTTKILSFKKLVDGAPFDKVRVYGQKRPEVIVISMKGRYEHRLFFLDKSQKVKKRMIVRLGNLIFSEHQRAFMINLHTSGPRLRRLKLYARTLIDFRGKVIWRSNYSFGGHLPKFAITPNFQRTLVTPSHIYGGGLFLFDKNGKKIKDLYTGSHMGHMKLDPYGKHAIYTWKGYHTQTQNHISTIVKVGLNNLEEFHRIKIPGNVQFLQTSRTFSAVVMHKDNLKKKQMLYVLNSKLKVKWKKDLQSDGGYSRVVLDKKGRYLWLSGTWNKIYELKSMRLLSKWKNRWLTDKIKPGVNAPKRFIYGMVPLNFPFYKKRSIHPFQPSYPWIVKGCIIEPGTSGYEGLYRICHPMVKKLIIPDRSENK